MKLPTFNLSQEALSHFEDSVQKEWIITNGLGGYASSTALGINTRKYHGLLVAAMYPPSDRRVCLTKLDEELSIGSSSYPLGANEFQNEVFPKGYLFLKGFSLSPFPTYTYSVQDVEIRKTVFMPHEKNASVILYRISNEGKSDVRFRVSPLTSWRHFHSVIDRWKTPPSLRQKHTEREVEIDFTSPESSLTIAITSGHFHPASKWLDRVYYREEAKRGESYLDDCYQPGFFETDTKGDKIESFAVVAAASRNMDAARELMQEMPLTAYDAEALADKENDRRETFLTDFREQHAGIPDHEWLRWLILATDAFVVKGADSSLRSVIAGYHWFESWGRDTFVSLPGLLLVTGRYEDARRVFLNFKRHCRKGLIPNYIPESVALLAYNSVDATLWYVDAVLQYMKYTGDFEFVRKQLWETLKDIVRIHVNGTEFNIGVDADGLLRHGAQLTWMDAVVDGQPVTPRAGKAVEVEALWYNALKIMELLAKRFDEKDNVEIYKAMAEQAKRSFVEEFWNPERSCLFDVVSGNERDGSLRPNQIIAVALDFNILDDAKNESIVDIVCRELLTPRGLRTLVKSDPRYVGVYAGDRRSRDSAYHNGTVWPWLLGPLTTAFLKTKGRAGYRRECALRSFLAPLLIEQIFEGGLGTLNEIYDGDSPHTPRGCIAQAWSVAEVLRTYVEEIMQLRPEYEKKTMEDSL